MRNCSGTAARFRGTLCIPALRESCPLVPSCLFDICARILRIDSPKQQHSDETEQNFDLHCRYAVFSTTRRTNLNRTVWHWDSAFLYPFSAITSWNRDRRNTPMFAIYSCRNKNATARFRVILLARTQWDDHRWRHTHAKKKTRHCQQACVEHLNVDKQRQIRVCIPVAMNTSWSDMHSWWRE